MTVNRLYFDVYDFADVNPPAAAPWTMTGSPLALMLSSVPPPTNGAIVNRTSGQTENSAVVQQMRMGYGVTTSGFREGLLSGSFKAAIPGECNSSSNGKLRVIGRVVSADGLTVRGTLFDLSNPSIYDRPSDPMEVKTVSGALTPITAQAGDRIVVEVGQTGDNTNISGFTYLIRFAALQPGPATGDVAFADAITTENEHPWIEFTFDDPANAPGSLTLSNPQIDSIDMDWTAGAPSVPALQGYRIRVNGGAAVDVGNVLDHTVSGLAADTLYTLGVQAYNAIGSSAWVEDDLATLPALLPPTDLILVPGIFNIAASWTAPVLGDVPDGYLLRVDGGDPIDVGDVLSYNITGLTPETLYEVEVRSYLLVPGAITEYPIAAVSASEHWLLNPPSRAIDGDLATSWRMLSSAGWLQVYLGEAKRIGTYRIRAGGGGAPEYAPKNWQLFGSNDGVNWTLYAFENNQTGWAGEERTFETPADSFFRYLSLTITARNGGDFTGVHEFRVFSNVPATYDESDSALEGSTTTLNDGLNNLYVGASEVAALYVGASPVPKAYFADTLTFEL